MVPRTRNTTMATQSELIYYPNSRPNTWWHYTKNQTKRSSAAKLRGLKSNGGWAKERSTTIQAVEKKLAQKGTLREPAPLISIKHKDYWKWALAAKNLDLPSQLSDEDASETRLLTHFNRDILEVHANTSDPDKANLRPVVKEWLKNLTENVTDKTDKINDFDFKDTTSCARSDTGKGWQSYLLETCRHNPNGVPLSQPERYLTVNNRNSMQCKVFFAAQEINLTISRKVNPFVKDREGRINPDGLGVDASGHLAIFEMKGPKDDLDPRNAIVQGVLGAIACQSKFTNLAERLRKPSRKKSLRPPCPKVIESKISVYVLISTSPSKRKKAPGITKACRAAVTQLLVACDFINEVSVFRISDADRKKFTSRELQRAGRAPWLPSLTASNSWIRSEKDRINYYSRASP